MWRWDSFPLRWVRLALRLGAMAFMAFMLAALLRAAARLPVSLHDSPDLLLILAGLALGLVLFSACLRLWHFYVFGHELTHWLAAKLFRRQTRRFRVGGGGGSIQVEDPNLWIVLAPYFVPLYAIVWLIAGRLTRIWYDPAWLDTVYVAGIGFWYAYHLVLTAMALSEDQPDLAVFGRCFSVLLIATINVAILYVALALFSGLGREGAAALGEACASQARWLWGLLGGG